MSCLGFALLPSSIRGSEARKQEKEKKDGVSKASSETGNPISYVERSKKNKKPKYLKTVECLKYYFGETCNFILCRMNTAGP